MGPYSNRTGVLIKKGHLDIDTHTQEECHVKMEAEISLRAASTSQGAPKMAGRPAAGGQAWPSGSLTTQGPALLSPDLALLVSKCRPSTCAVAAAQSVAAPRALTEQAVRKASQKRRF